MRDAGRQEFVMTFPVFFLAKRPPEGLSPTELLTQSRATTSLIAFTDRAGVEQFVEDNGRNEVLIMVERPASLVKLLRRLARSVTHVAFDPVRDGSRMTRLSISSLIEQLEADPNSHTK